MELEIELNRKNAHREMSEGKTILNSMPITVEVSSTNVCNINPPCVMCGKREIDSTAKRDYHLNKDLANIISKGLNKVSTISLHGLGEPLANPRLFEILENVSPEANIVFNSNGLLLDNKRIDDVIAAKVKNINFSLDASTAETYKKIRGQDFDKVLGNIRNLQKKKKELGINYPAITINMTLMRENIGDIPEFMILAKELNSGVALIHMNEGHDYKVEMNGWTFDYESQQCHHDPEYHDQMIEEAFRLSALYQIPFYFLGERTLSKRNRAEVSKTSPISEKPKFFCPRPWESLFINIDGDVQVCCHQTYPIGNIHPRLKLSFNNIFKVLPYLILRNIYNLFRKRNLSPISFRENSIKDIWNCKAMQTLRQQMLNHEIPEICRGQNRCSYRGRF